MQEVQMLFKRQFGYMPHIAASAPARVELLGCRADENQGLLLSLAINRYAHVAVSPRTDGRIEVFSSAFDTPTTFTISAIEREAKSAWMNPLKGVLLQLRKRGVHFGGFTAAIHSEIPMGIGLGSSAAVEVAFALAMRNLHPFRITDTGVLIPPRRTSRGRLPPLKDAERVSMARVCQHAEAAFAEVPGGIGAPVASLMAREYQAIEWDCMNHAAEHHPLAGDFLLVICDTGVPRNLNSTANSLLDVHCKLAARGLGLKSLRSVDADFLLANRWRLRVREQQCANHVVGENRRIVFAGRALREGDLGQFGNYLLQSHDSARDLMKNSHPELDLLVHLARKVPSCFGARLTGAGFGGATVNLVASDDVDAFVRTMQKGYERATGRTLWPMICRSVAGPEG